MFAVLHLSYAAQLAFGALGFGSGTCALAELAATATTTAQAARTNRTIVARCSGCDISSDLHRGGMPAESRRGRKLCPMAGGGEGSGGPRADTMHVTRPARESLNVSKFQRV